MPLDLRTELDRQRQKVDVDHFDLTIREVIRMATQNIGGTTNKELNIAPVYQRKFRWKAEDESRLIESIFLGLPVPPVFVAANKDGSWEVVDGLQRISTLIHYVEPDAESLAMIEREEALSLKGLEKLPNYNDKRFEDLPTPLQLDFNKRMIRMTTLSDKSDDEVRYDLFERLNTGGISLTPQEVRACIYKGEFVNFLSDLADNQDFQSLLKLKKNNENDGTKEELVLKFFAYKDHRSHFTGNVKEFLNDYTRTESNSLDLHENGELFEKVVHELNKIIDGQFVRSSSSITSINQLEPVLVAAGELLEEGRQDFSPKNGWIDDAELVFYSTGGTNTKAMLEGRVKRAKELLQGAEIKEEFNPS